MNATISGDKLTIDIGHLFQEVTDPDVLLEFAQRIGCHDAVLVAVAQQIVYRCTDQGYSGSTVGYVSQYAHGLDAAIRIVILGCEDVAKRELLRLEEELERERGRTRAAWDKMTDLRARYER